MDQRDIRQLQLLREYLRSEHTTLARQLPSEVRRWLLNAVSWRIQRAPLQRAR